jgi:hypothetical protein
MASKRRKKPAQCEGQAGPRQQLRRYCQHQLNVAWRVAVVVGGFRGFETERLADGTGCQQLLGGMRSGR